MARRAKSVKQRAKSIGYRAKSIGQNARRMAFRLLIADLIEMRRSSHNRLYLRQLSYQEQ
jgi:hypothetical protein